MNTSNSWQQIIWREWRHSSDPLYTDRLFKLVSDQPLGWGAQMSVIMLNALGGAALGILVGLLFTSSWGTLKHMVWLGGVLGVIYGWVQSKKFTWRTWLERVASNTPTGNFGRLVVSLIVMGIIGGMVFGPLFWLTTAGLFWAFGEIITWINRSVTTTGQNWLDERRWWFWWRKRPHLLEVEQALHQACTTSQEAQELWQAPLHRLTKEREQQPTIETLINQLLSPDWLDRFIARQLIIQRGQEAIFSLQTTVHSNNTPHQDTLAWLLENLQTKSPSRVPAAIGPEEGYDKG